MLFRDDRAAVVDLKLLGKFLAASTS
jgi:hypothetical protein